MMTRLTLSFAVAMAAALAASGAAAEECEGIGASECAEPVILKEADDGATTMLIRSTGSYTMIGTTGMTGDTFWQQCAGFWTVNADKSSSSAGSCFSLDGDGDQWITSWEGVNSGGTWANVSGTGKFAGWQNSKGTWTYGARYGDGLRLTLWKGTCGE
jgi:hypothetical protein